MSTVRFFVWAFAITWVLQLPALLAGSPDKYMALVGLGAFGPMFAAMIVARRDLRALFGPLRLWRVGPLWYVAALALPGAAFVVPALVWGHSERLLYPPSNAAFALAAIVFPFGEEIGWRGFALPRLIERFGPFWASVVLGALWTLWHVPMLTLQGIVDVRLYAIFFPFMIGGSVLFTWIWRRTGGSLLLAVLTHVGAHLNNSGHALPARATPIALHAAGYVVLAIALVALDRRAFSS